MLSWYLLSSGILLKIHNESIRKFVQCFTFPHQNIIACPSKIVYHAHVVMAPMPSVSSFSFAIEVEQCCS